jgi:putative endonuclease
MPFVYIVRCSDGTLYTGWAVDVAARVKAHNAGRGAKYTRTRLPVKLVYSEELPTRAEAMKRERQIKRYPKAKKLELVIGETGQRMAHTSPPHLPSVHSVDPNAL